MDVGPHQLRERVVYGAVTFDRRQTGESAADDLDAEMPAAVARAGVAGMAVAVVVDFEQLGCECAFERRADRIDPLFARQRSRLRHVHGSTGRNGRTSTRA